MTTRTSLLRLFAVFFALSSFGFILSTADGNYYDSSHYGVRELKTKKAKKKGATSGGNKLRKTFTLVQGTQETHDFPNTLSESVQAIGTKAIHTGSVKADTKSSATNFKTDGSFYSRSCTVLEGDITFDEDNAPALLSTRKQECKWHVCFKEENPNDEFLDPDCLAFSYFGELEREHDLKKNEPKAVKNNVVATIIYGSGKYHGIEGKAFVKEKPAIGSDPSNVVAGLANFFEFDVDILFFLPELYSR